MKPLLLIGGGGPCRSSIDVVESTGLFRIVGIVERAGASAEVVLEYPVVGYDDALAALLEDCPYVLITVGQIKSPDARIRLYEQVRSCGGILPVVVSSHAYLSPRAEIGDGSILMHGSTVSAGSSVGVNCIINSHALIEHDSTVGAHTHISTGVRVNGGSTIGEHSFVGSGAIINQGITVGERCVIASGEVVRNDVPAGSRLVGPRR